MTHSTFSWGIHYYLLHNHTGGSIFYLCIAKTSCATNYQHEIKIVVKFMKINSLSFLFQQHALESFKLHPHWLLSICCLGDLPHLLHKGLLHISEFVFQVADVSRCLFTLYWYCISQVAVGTLSCGELWATSRTELMAIQFVCFNYQKITGKQISKRFYVSLSISFKVFSWRWSPP